MIGFLWGYLKKDIRSLCLNVGFILLQIIVQTVFVMGEMKNIIDNGVVQMDMQYIYRSGIKMLILSVLSGMCTIVASRYSAIVTAGLVSRIREDCFKKVVSMTPQEMACFGESTLLNRTVSDATQIQLLIINLMRTSLLVPVLIICMLFLLFRINRIIFCILFFMFAFTVAVLVILGTRAKPYFEMLQKKIDTINLLLKEKITGVRPIRAFGNENIEEEKMQEVSQKAREASLEANKRINFLSPASMVIMNWTVVLIYLASSSLLRAKMASVSDLILVFQYLGYFISSLAVIPMLVNLLPKVIVSCRRIQELLRFDNRADGRISMDKEQQEVERGEIEFKDVIFGYAGATDVITHISLTIPAGRTTAFIGTTGSGKTTIMNLIMGFYEPTFGEIYVDGVSLKERDMNIYRPAISYATQKAYVFQDTVYNNLSMYDAHVTKDRVMAACDAAGFKEVLELMPEGLNTIMAQGGTNISGGQRQRLSLARTVTKEAKIYIFDDTFSALDAKTEKNAREKIFKMLSGKTIVMVAQKIDTIKHADQIVVLKHGQIAGIGRHEELLNTCGEYQEIYKTQNYMEKRG